MKKSFLARPTNSLDDHLIDGVGFELLVGNWAVKHVRIFLKFDDNV